MTLGLLHIISAFATFHNCQNTFAVLFLPCLVFTFLMFLCLLECMLYRGLRSCLYSCLTFSREEQTLKVLEAKLNLMQLITQRTEHC